MVEFPATLEYLRKTWTKGQKGTFTGDWGHSHFKCNICTLLHHYCYAPLLGPGVLHPSRVQTLRAWNSSAHTIQNVRKREKRWSGAGESCKKEGGKNNKLGCPLKDRRRMSNIKWLDQTSVTVFIQVSGGNFEILADIKFIGNFNTAVFFPLTCMQIKFPPRPQVILKNNLLSRPRFDLFWREAEAGQSIDFLTYTSAVGITALPAAKNKLTDHVDDGYLTPPPPEIFRFSFLICRMPN